MRIAVLATALSSAVVSLALADPAAAAIKTPTNIAPQELSSALRVLAADRHLQILYTTVTVANRQSSGAVGQFTVDEALTRLLGGTGLAFQYIDENTITVMSRDDGASTSLSTKGRGTEREGSASAGERSKSFWSRLRLAQADTPSASQVDAQNPSPSKGEGQGEDEKEAQSQKRIELEEIVVTGTNIRGSGPSVSPVATYSQDQIQDTGATTVAEFLQKVPMNFASASESTIGAFTGGRDSINTSNGAGLNLRGLGAGSTLTLLNGRRFAAGSTSGAFVDASMIPLNAVERIEIVPDGASAIYGADAVGGVVNFILRERYDGADVGIRYKWIDGTPSDERAVSASAGHTWASGSALASIDVAKRSALEAIERFRVAPQPFSLLGEQERSSALVRVEQNINPSLKVFADLIYAKRNGESEVTTTVSRTQRYDVEAHGVTAGASLDLGRRAILDFAATDSKSVLFLDSINRLTGSPATLQKIYSTQRNLDLKASGDLLTIPTGVIKYAIGAQLREEEFRNTNRITNTSVARLDRRVSAGFAEVRVPLLKFAQNDSPDLELVLADRQESYDDFGSTNNPKIGLVWTPVDGLSFRGSWGTSFRAPLLTDVNPVPESVVVLPVPDPLRGGATTDVILIFGGNPDLEPETSENWTLGVDFNPSFLPGLSSSLSYYRIDYDDRIINPQSTVTQLDAFRQESLLGPNIVRRNPSAAEVQFWASQPGFDDRGRGTANIGAIVDYRQQNLANVVTDGIEWASSYSRPLGDGRLGTELDVAYVLDFKRRVTPTGPELDVLDTPYNPLDLRVRAGATYGWSDFAAAVNLNYADSYEDRRLGSFARVDSWLTLDLSLSYQVSQGPLAGTAIRMTVNNLTNEQAPYLKSDLPAVLGPIPTYDGTNANALGRYFSVELRKAW